MGIFSRIKQGILEHTRGYATKDDVTFLVVQREPSGEGAA